MSNYGDGDWAWCKWTPENAENVAYEDIAEAIESFESLDTPAGEAATAWLRSESLANHPSTVTYVLAEDGQIEGFFAIASSVIQLTQRHRKQLGPGDRPYPLAATQGATLVAWLARHRDAEGRGLQILRYAVSVALDVAARQGSVAFVLDPHDDAIAKIWGDNYGFRRSQTTVRGPDGAERTRLWIPLHRI